jgi:hypothetical protein
MEPEEDDRQRRKTWRQRLWLLMSDPSSSTAVRVAALLSCDGVTAVPCCPSLSPWLHSSSFLRQARALAVMVMLTIVLSTTSFLVETLPEFHRRNGSTWNKIEAVCISLFTAE